VLRIGSRESALAVIQAETAVEKIRRFDESVTVKIITMKTRGDVVLDRPLESIGGKGLFIKELDRALLDGEIHAAVHSLKDIPASVEKGIRIKSFLRRDDPRDALVLPAGETEADMSRPLGCSGGRRRSQLQKLFPGWEIRPVRGNVLTRLQKLDGGEYGALVLAAASLQRLSLTHRISRLFSVEEIIPAAGQGIIAVCAKDEDASACFDAIDDAESRVAALAERAFVRALDGGCGAPIAAYAEVSGGSGGVMTVRGLYAEAESADFVTGNVSGQVTESEELGKELAVKLLIEYHRKTGAKTGKVTLLGAGPGDPGLLTVKAREALGEADIVLYDNLAGRGVIARIPAGAKTVYVGKKAGNHTVRQDEINFLLLKEAAAGKNVVRLKGGDPFLFARGGEELELLSRAGIPFDVIPGVSSALAVPAYAGIPATHRSFCSQVHIVSAHLKDGSEGMNYRALVEGGGTIIFLMGASALKSICDGLLEAWMGPDTPAAIVEQGSTAKQKKVVSTVARLYGDALEAGIAPPAITIVGGVCALSQRFSWFERKPLSGVRIGVTRPASRPARLSALLAAEGAEVVEIPSIETRAIKETDALKQALLSLRGGEWFAFTSPAGVEVFFDKILEYGFDVRALAESRFAAIGRTTAGELARRGIIADFVPETFSGKALGQGLADTITRGKCGVLGERLFQRRSLWPGRSELHGSQRLHLAPAEGDKPHSGLPLSDAPAAHWTRGTMPLGGVTGGKAPRRGGSVGPEGRSVGGDFPPLYPTVILPRSRIAGADVTEALTAAGVGFVDIPIYDAAPPPHRDDPYFIELVTEGLDWLTFTSASTVRGFLQIAGEERAAALRAGGLRALCIGRQTAEVALRAGFDVVTAKNATLEDMVNAILCRR
jgi:uroporphyrinogen III methyltransferase/synthase